MDKQKTYGWAVMELLRIRQIVNGVISQIGGATTIGTPKGISFKNLDKERVKSDLDILAKEAAQIAKIAKTAKKCIA